MITATRPLVGHPVHGRYDADGTVVRVRRLGVYVLACMEVAGQRRRLSWADDALLKDIGISRADAMREAGRGFWDIPDDQKPRP